MCSAGGRTQSKEMVVGIYCRISKDKGTKDKSIEDQSKLGIAFCQKNKYQYSLYIDEGLSGTLNDRPEFQRLLSDIVDSKIQMIWVFDDSRIQRSPQIRYLLNDYLKKYKVKYYTHLNGLVDLYNPETELMGGILAEFNKYFVTLSKLKVKSVLKRRALSGKGWGILPYGYSYDENGYYIINKKEAAIVKKIFKMSLSGIGTDSIAKLLNEEGVPTRYNEYDGEIRFNKKKGSEHIKLKQKKNVKWAGNTIRGIIKNTMYYGIKKINDITIEVPPIFSVDFWEEVNYNLSNKNSNTKGKGGTKKYEYLLNGLIKCAKCGRNYNGKTRSSKKDHFYYCMSKRVNNSNCGNRSINIDKIENFVWHVLFQDQRIFEAIKNNLSGRKDIENAKKRLVIENQKLDISLKGKDNILDLVKKGVLGVDEVAKKMQEIRNEIESHRQTIEDLSSQIENNTTVDLEELKSKSSYFQKMQFNEKRRLVEKYIKSINILWVDDLFNGKKVNYYVVTVEYTVKNIIETYTNSYALNLDEWYKVKYDSKLKKAYFDYCYKPNSSSTISEIPFFSFKGEVFPDYTTLAPNGDSGLWTFSDYCEYYGKEKYLNLKAELDHKVKSKTFSNLINTKK